jgi:tRNA U55 pseudouridine synthase TruB
MKTLERCEASGFVLADGITLSDLEALSLEERWARVLPTEVIFADKREVILPPFFARLARAGQEIYLKKLKISLDIGEQVRLADAEGFFALGEVREFEGGAAIKPIRQF